MKLDITTAATLRPSVLAYTYATFTQHLLRPGIADYRCVINIDTIGEDISPDKVIDVAKGFFPNVLANVCHSPSFGNAQKWTWSHTDAKYVFNLEDDWEILRPLNLADMIAIMEENPTLAHLRLSMFPAKNLPKGSPKGEGICLRQWARYIPWNGRFFEVPDWRIGQLGYCNHPSLCRGDFVRTVNKFFRDDYSPEKILKHRAPEIRSEMAKWRYGVYHEYRHAAQPTIRDHGRPWRDAHHWFKTRGYSFRTWKKA